MPANGFSARWTGSLVAPAAGTYRFQTVSDDGVRLTVGGSLLIDDWNDHAAKTDISTTLVLAAGQRVPMQLDYYENAGQAVARLLWQAPGATTFVAVPAASLMPN